MPEINFADAQQAIGFIQPQLLRIEAQVYAVKYPSFDYSGLMYVNTDGDMWDVGSIFYSGDIAGRAEFLSGAGFDMPYASVSRSQYLQTNHFAGIGYEWNLQELKRAEKLGRQLGAEKGMAASKVAEAFLYNIAIRGSVEKGQTGLVNDANVPVANVAATGTGSTTGWANKTPDQILIDVNLALNTPFNNTRETQIANTLLLPTTAMQYLASTRIGSEYESILKFIRENNYYILTTGQALTIKATRELETAGTSGTRRIIAYDNSREVLQYHLPGPHTFLPVFQKAAMTWEVPGIMNVGGVEVRLPRAMAYFDAI